ncbi:MAG: CDP-glucose 4,6-dehydratase [Kiritimatiellia bacterium]|nr:CDP-glucose 4,6-dehydratase [Kiritimatiellia bacterium]
MAVKTFHSVFKNKSVLVTGHTGFKGSWLTLWLNSLGAKVCGYSLPAPKTVNNNFRLSKIENCLTRHIEADIRDYRRLKKCLHDTGPDFIFHLAAQSLVRRSYRAPLETFETNVIGTVNLLEAVRELKPARARPGRPCVVVVVTSDKCYENTGKANGYREGDPMGGHDPYSASKGAVEIVTASYRRSFFSPENSGKHGVKLSSARSGNVIGGGDWAPDRIMPDCISALIRHKPINVRNPRAVRPWQHVLEPLSGYLTLAAKLDGMNGKNGKESCPPNGGYCEAWNFGPSGKSMHPVKDLVEETIKHWGNGSWRDTSDKNAPHEAACLTLSSEKTQRRLGWRNVWDFSQAVEKTVSWYKAWHGKKTDLGKLCLAQITQYCEDAQ